MTPAAADVASKKFCAQKIKTKNKKRRRRENKIKIKNLYQTPYTGSKIIK